MNKAVYLLIMFLVLFPAVIAEGTLKGRYCLKEGQLTSVYSRNHSVFNFTLDTYSPMYLIMQSGAENDSLIFSNDLDYKYYNVSGDGITILRNDSLDLWDKKVRRCFDVRNSEPIFYQGGGGGISKPIVTEVNETIYLPIIPEKKKEFNYVYLLIAISAFMVIMSAVMFIFKENSRDEIWIWEFVVCVILPVLLLTIGYIFQLRLFLFMSLYGVVTISKLIFQIIFAHSNSKKIWSVPKSFNPKVTVVVPIFKEEFEDLYNCIKSIAVQDYKNYDVVMIDDGSGNGIAKKVYDKISKAYPNLEIELKVLSENQGKRFAQHYAFSKYYPDIFVTIDSDTMIAKDGLREIIKPLYDEKIGAVTGDSSVSNKDVNLLTRLLDLRYWLAFNVERSAQSNFGVVMCCSGVFSAYRAEIIKKVKGEYINQIFWGKLCHFGDDRHLTNLVLNNGYNVIFQDKAKAETIVPETMGKWLRQQLRWGKSFFREVKWNLPSLTKHHIYMSYDLLLQAILPFFLFISVVIYFYKGFSLSALYFGYYFIMLVLMAIVRVAYAIYRTGDLWFLIFPIYALLHIFLLIPIRLIAILTLPKNGWGTR